MWILRKDFFIIISQICLILWINLTTCIYCEPCFYLFFFYFIYTYEFYLWKKSILYVHFFTTVQGDSIDLVFSFFSVFIIFTMNSTLHHTNSGCWQVTHIVKCIPISVYLSIQNCNLLHAISNILVHDINVQKISWCHITFYHTEEVCGLWSCLKLVT